MSRLLAIVILLASGWASQAFWKAEYENSPSNVREWFQNLRQPPNRDFGCCSEADCRPVESRIVAKGYQAKLEDGEWYDVPEYVTETDPKVLRTNPTGSPVACTLGIGPGLRWLCFEPWDELG